MFVSYIFKYKVDITFGKEEHCYNNLICMKTDRYSVLDYYYMQYTK